MDLRLDFHRPDMKKARATRARALDNYVVKFSLALQARVGSKQLL
jgi:hypothetical protein